MTFSPESLANASTASERMDALCEFIEFWLGPRLEEYGEPAAEVDSYNLPLPLNRLYKFAGRWPANDKRRESPHAVGAFFCQDALSRLEKLELEGKNRIRFLTENQGCWTCSTLVEGDDPPVWCDGAHEDGKRKKVCESLSRFLVSFVLQELAAGSKLSLVDEGLSKKFAASKSEEVPIWERGPYVYGSDANYWLWNGVLVSQGYEDYSLHANAPEGIEFLTQNQGPVCSIQFMVGPAWRLEISPAGAAKLKYYDWPIEEEAPVKAGTFDFEQLLQQLSKIPYAESARNPDTTPVLFLRRRGQSWCQGRYLEDKTVARPLFSRAFDNLAEPIAKMAELHRERPPFK